MASFLIISIVALSALFLISTLISLKTEYKKSHWLFEVAHLFAGFFVAMFFSGFIGSPVFILLATLATGGMWEIFELIRSRNQKLDTFLSKLNIKQGEITLPDTLLDLFLDLAGAILFIFLLQ